MAIATSGMEVIRTVPPPGVEVVHRDDAFMPVMRIERAMERYNAVVIFMQKIMKDGKDYGAVPGSDRPSLLKPGAEKLCSFFGLTPRFTLVTATENWGDDLGNGLFFYYHYRCSLYRGDILIGEGEGSCNSHESKYHYRWVSEGEVPEGLNKGRLRRRGGKIFEPQFAIDKAQTSGKWGKPPEYWQRFKDEIAAKTATSATKRLGENLQRGWEIDSIVFRVPNPDIADQVNTIQKMGQKRAFIAGVLIACNASEYFTQDVEDLETIEGFGSEVSDTGGHLTGTKAAAEHDSEKKIEQAEPERTTAAPTPAPTRKQSEKQAEVPEEVQKMWAQMTDIKATLAVFHALKLNISELIGKEAGERLYYTILGKQGVQHANQFKSRNPARAAARELLEAIRAAQTPPRDDITDDDLPPGMFPDQEPF